MVKQTEAIGKGLKEIEILRQRIDEKKDAVTKLRIQLDIMLDEQLGIIKVKTQTRAKRRGKVGGKKKTRKTGGKKHSRMSPEVRDATLKKLSSLLKAGPKSVGDLAKKASVDVKRVRALLPKIKGLKKKGIAINMTYSL